MLRTRRTVVAGASLAAVLGIGGVGIAAACGSGSHGPTASPGSIATKARLVHVAATARTAGVSDTDDTTSTTVAPTTTEATTSTTEVTEDTTSTTVAPETTTTVATTPSTVLGDDDDHKSCDHAGLDDEAHELGEVGEHHGKAHEGDDASANGRKAGFVVVSPSANHGSAPKHAEFGRRRHGHN
jgi:hypothetical protein